MANQMIALQARNPQLPDPARATTQMANMMNMASQQRAAQLQGQRTRQEMDYAEAGESRAAATHTSAQKKAELEYVGLVAKQFSEDVAKLREGDIAGAEALRANVVRDIPAWGDYIRPASEWTPEYITQLMSKASEIVAQTNPPAQSRMEYTAEDGEDEQGRRIPKNTPVQVTTGLRPSVKVIRDAPAAAAPRATPTAPQPSAMERGPSATSGAPMTFGTDAERPLNAYQQEDLRNLEGELGMTDTPASFTGGGMGGAGAGQMTPDVMSRIVDSAFQTGVMAQVDFDQLLASQAPQNKQALMNAFQQANITLQADAPSLAGSGMGQQQMAANPVQRPQAGFADFRGQRPPVRTANLGGDMSMMRNTEAQYTPLQPRNREASPTPGIYNVSTQDVAATSRAQRPSKQELYDEAAAKIAAERDAGPAPLTSLQRTKRETEVAKAYSQTQGLINKTYDPKEGVIALARKIKSLSRYQKEAITGFSNYLPSVQPSSREADTLFGNLKGVITAAGKDAASASGAIGPMAVQEWTIVANTIATLDLASMTPTALDAQMDRIITQVSNATNLAVDVYDVQFGGDVKEYPKFNLRRPPPPATKTPVVKGGSRISPDVDKILKSRGL